MSHIWFLCASFIFGKAQVCHISEDLQTQMLSIVYTHLEL